VCVTRMPRPGCVCVLGGWCLVCVGVCGCVSLCFNDAHGPSWGRVWVRSCVFVYVCVCFVVLATAQFLKFLGGQKMLMSRPWDACV